MGLSEAIVFWVIFLQLKKLTFVFYIGIISDHFDKKNERSATIE